MGKEWTKFFIVSFGGLLINLAIFDLVTTMWGMRDILGLFFATCVGTLWNFILNKKWTFKK
jgi:putative flippase GtrA